MEKARLGVRSSRERSQLATYLGLAAVAVGLTGVLQLGDDPFGRFIGSLPPMPAVGAVAVVGLGLLGFLRAFAGYAVVHGETRRGLILAPVLATALAALMVLVDMVSPFRADINVPFPESVLFYPVIGLVVEVVFHLVPLGLFLLAYRPLRRGTGDQGGTWAGVVLVALVEPVYQTILATPHEYPVWQTAYTAVHIYVINVLQLWIFRRYDFLSMYSFRVAYYAVWHIAWGHLRLSLLF